MENEENEKMENLEKAYRKIIEDMEERLQEMLTPPEYLKNTRISQESSEDLASHH